MKLSLLLYKTALYLAVEKKNLKIIKLLLSNDKIDVNIINKSSKDEKSSLHLAVQRESIEIIKSLLSFKKTKINIKDSQGKKPIDYATNDEIIQLLNH